MGFSEADYSLFMPVMSVFGVDIPSFSVMDLALWPQAITLTLLLKASGMDIWNSFKASNGHLLQGLGNTIFPSGAATLSSSNNIPTLPWLSGGSLLADCPHITRIGSLPFPEEPHMSRCSSNLIVYPVRDVKATCI